ncbi:trans-aconitate 2-methyltransferase [Aspergillus homomorphus CBS 101889]|uniref:Trans-aconitate 2-methyltransferase n=1 Tax=Aspergillus homomorphus (strain CBS 101889) TaxID=1450537 RepID=A0A395I4P3_ASPHC|nr:trans-aconitate 2-methyltransferase [Aspergillus homomorphus CBS 101889]RAL14709.1 trans-aconitate 2-methyltransferase [Aspergillus homomorphus CBS 101889]
MSSQTTNNRSDWSASQYLKFEDERTRPARDLLSQVPIQNPKIVVDLGCGPGNSTAVLEARYPEAHIEGIDSSPDMIQKARSVLPSRDFSVQDLESYAPAQPVDLFYSNAVLHWLKAPTRLRVIQNLIKSQPSGGVFAFQVPDNLSEPSHALVRETAEQGPWAGALRDMDRDPFQSPQEIYDALKPLCSTVNIVKTEYYHPLADHKAVIEWVKGTGLRPYLDPLTSADKESFLDRYLKALKKAYPISVDGKVLLRYPRLFVVAVKE